MRKNKVLTYGQRSYLHFDDPLLIITVTAFGGGSAITFPIESFSTKWFANVFALKSFRRSFLTSLESRSSRHASLFWSESQRLMRWRDPV